jgi:CDP-4-dehydro-6-deoxyglucose reductase, E3
MAFNITLQPSGLQFAADEDSTLLDAAEKAGVAMPYGCRGGSCGACKGKVVTGKLECGIEDRFALTEAERASGYMLLCVAHPKSDVVVEVADVGRMGDIVVKTMPTRITTIERAASDVVVVTLKLPATESFEFRAGQYIALQFKDGERRDFSIANAPHERQHVQLHIRLSEGSYSTLMFTEVLKEKDILRFEGPLGSFHLNPASGKPMIMVAAGTGFAPIKAILDDMAHKGIQREVHLYRGSRDRAGLYLPHLPARWEKTIADFTHVPVLSDATLACAWNGRTGLVHQAVLEDIADLSVYEVYACGAVAMIEATRRDFIAHGLPPEAFFADAFTAAPITK